jgi:hypothetical protein
MERVFGKEYPAKGMLLAMGTHSLHQDDIGLDVLSRGAPSDIRE